jgi:tetratricopeptide (TPR) repeat protein
MSAEDSLSERERRLDEVVTAYLQALGTGSAPNREALLAQHPDLAEELVELLDFQDRLYRLATPLRCVARAAERVTPIPTETLSDAGAEPASATAGRELGRYELLGRIGAGGMGVVYRARQKGLNRLVALKVIRMREVVSADEARRFRAEAETAAALDHPHVVPVYEVSEHQGQLFYSMRLMEGGSLATQLERFQAELREAARLVAAIARAVHHAHQRGILHRDLKPGNILLDAEGQPHVSDFGLAKRVESDGSLTQTGAIVGTPQYMAPEQTRGQKGAVTTATDVYGLGAVLYALLTGKAPFRGETALETLEQVRDREPEPPRRSNPKVDRDLETICLKCLHKDPARRYSSAEAVAEDLERWLAGEPIRARRSSLWERLWCWCRRNPVIAALSVTVLLLVLLAITGLAIGTWLLWRERGQTQEALAQAQRHAQRAEEQRRRAEGNFGRALDGMTNLLDHLDEKEWPQPLEIEQVQQSLLRQVEAYFQSFLADNKDDPVNRLQVGWAYQHLGVFYGRRGDAVRAERCYRTAVAFHEGLAADHPNDPAPIWMYAQSLDRLGKLLHRTGRRSEAHVYLLQAREQYRRQVKVNPDWRAHNDLGRFLVTCPDDEVRNVSEALAAASQAIALSGESSVCLGTLGMAQYRKGELDAAESSLQKYLVTCPDDERACFYLAMTYCKLRNEERAKHYFSQGRSMLARMKYPYVAPAEACAEAAALLRIPEQPIKGKEIATRKH